jgi:hypothetical protein
MTKVRARFGYFGRPDTTNLENVPQEFSISGDLIEGKLAAGMEVRIPNRNGSHLCFDILRVDFSDNPMDPSRVVLVLNTGNVQDWSAVEFLNNLKIDGELLSVTKVKTG